MWSAFDGYSWLGIWCFGPPIPSLSLSLSPSHTTTFSFNVRVGFLSYLPNWNLLSGSGGGWWVTPVWVVMRTHLLSLSPASLYSLLPFSRPLLLPHYQPLIFSSNIIHNFTHNFPLFPFTSPSCFQFLPNFILSHLTRPSRLTVFYGRKKGSHNFFRIFFQNKERKKIIWVMCQLVDQGLLQQWE